LTKPDQLADANANPNADAVAVGVGDGGRDRRARHALPRRLPRPRDVRLPRPLTTVALIAAVFFALGSIGTPLLGISVFAPTDELSTKSPYYDAGLAGTVVQNTFQDDVYTAAIPSAILYAQSVRDGDPASWNPYISGGTPLGANPSYALLSPLSLPYYVLPGWLAPAYLKLLEIAVTLLGAYLFLRMLRLSRPAALLGGTVFASSAFMVMWTNWPQTRVAALIPWVFWAAERFVRHRRVTDAVLLALPIAFMLVGGFPAVTTVTLLTAGAYFLVRVIAEHREQRRRVVGLILGAAGAVVGAVALAAIQLLPFASFYSSWLIEGRDQTPTDHLTLTELATIFAPWTFGGVSRRTDQPFWYAGHNMVEASSYIGAAALVLVVVSVALARSGRALLPKGAWAVLVAAAAAWLVVIYVGWPLRLLQDLPVFSTNFVGRARSILGFLLAVLAAVGLELLLRRRSDPSAERTSETSEPRPTRRRPQLYGVAVWLAATGTLALLGWKARGAAVAADRTLGLTTVDRSDYATRQLSIGAALVALAVLAVAALYWPARLNGRRARGVRFGAAALLLVLVGGQAMSYAVPYYPRVARETFYPETDVHRFLAEHLGHERYVGTTDAMFMGLDSAKRLRAVTGHTFVNTEFAAMVRGVPGNPIRYPTYILFGADPRQAASPILDRLGGRYYVTSPRDPVFGAAHTAAGDGSTVVLQPGRPVTAPIGTGGPVRAVGFTATGSLPAASANSWVDVVVRDRTGAVVASGRRLTAGMTAGKPFLVPISGEPAGTGLSVAITLTAPAPVAIAGTGAGPAISSVTGGGDGLLLAYAGSSVVYERLTALPRIRWASATVVERDEERRIALLASGSLQANQVVLNEPGAAAERRPATVDVISDGTDAISARVDAEGAGYLVVADADQVGWSASVDGKPARLMAADQGVVAVAVGKGSHTVDLRFAAPYHGVGTWLSLAALLTGVALVAGERWIVRGDPSRPRRRDAGRSRRRGRHHTTEA